MKSLLLIALMLSVMSTANAKPFYPACLKLDGDWLEGVTRKECVGKDVHGKWITMKQFKKMRNKVL